MSTLAEASFEAPFALAATSTRWDEDIALSDVALLDSGTLVAEFDGVEHEVEGKIGCGPRTDPSCGLQDRGVAA